MVNCNKDRESSIKVAVQNNLRECHAMCAVVHSMLEQLERLPLRGNIALFIHLYPACMLLVYIAN